MILVNIMKRNNKTIIAVCDEDSLDKKYSDGIRCLDLVKYKNFYKGERIDKFNKEEMIRELKKAESINVIGKESIEFIREAGFEISNTKIIGKGKDKVPHLQIYNSKIF